MKREKKKGQRALIAELQKSPAARRRIFEELIRHIKGGFSLNCFSSMSEIGIKSFLEKYPEEFSRDELESAMRDGQLSWERIGRQQADGSCLGNSRSWQYNMINRYGWTDRVESKTDVSGAVQVSIVSYADTRRQESITDSAREDVVDDSAT